MKKLAIAIVGFSLLITSQVFAQDTMIMRNGDEIKVKVEEVGQTEIRYRKFDNLTGPIYTVKKADVFMIRYENGQRDVFEEEKPAPATQPTSPIRVQPEQRSSNYSATDISKARSAATVGYVAMAPVLGLAVAAAASDDGTIPGAVATVIYGVTLPVVAGAGSKLRDKSGVMGSPGLRLAGWIGYGFGMVDAIIAVGLGASDIEVADGAVIALGVIGAASLAMMSTDVSTTARQAEAQLSARKFRVKPTVGYMNVNDSKMVPTVGLKIGF